MILSKVRVSHALALKTGETEVVTPTIRSGSFLTTGIRLLFIQQFLISSSLILTKFLKTPKRPTRLHNRKETPALPLRHVPSFEQARMPALILWSSGFQAVFKMNQRSATHKMKLQFWVWWTDILFHSVFVLMLVKFHWMNLHGLQMGQDAQLRNVVFREDNVPLSPSGAFCLNKVFTVT